MTARETESQSFADFSGGLNLTNAELADNETPESRNWTINETGSLLKRLGYTWLASPAIAFETLDYWPGGSKFVLQAGKDIYTSSALLTFTKIASWSTTALGGYIDFNGTLVAVHPVDGVYTWNGTTWTSVAATALGRDLAVWDNKVWICGDGQRIYCSAAGNPASYTVADDWVDIKEGEQSACTSIGCGQSMDDQGRPGLLVAKAHGLFRINDPDTGAFTTMSLTAGAANPRAVTTAAGETLFFGENGIFATNGSSEPKCVSMKVEPLFSSLAMNLSQLALVRSAAAGDRVYFSFPGPGQTANSRTLELHARKGWIMEHTFAGQGYASILDAGYMVSGSKTYRFGGPTDGFADTTPVAIASLWKSKHLIPKKGAGYTHRFRRIRGRGIGEVDLTTTLDEGLGETTTDTMYFTASDYWDDGGAWDDGGLWDSAPSAGNDDSEGFGCGKDIQITLENDSAEKAYGEMIAGEGTTPEAGCARVDSLLLESIQLGLS